MSHEGFGLVPKSKMLFVHK